MGALYPFGDNGTNGSAVIADGMGHEARRLVRQMPATTHPPAPRLRVPEPESEQEA